jgi:flagellar motility protein MotE (MotC chaperone)
MSSSEPKQLDLTAPKKDPTLESIRIVEQMIADITNAVAITFMSPLRDRGETFADAIRIAKYAFDSFVASPNSQNEEDWVDFFVKYAKNRDYGFSEKNLLSLRQRLEAIQKKRKIVHLFKVREQFESLLAENARGKVTLPKQTIEKVRELLFDLTLNHR